MALAPVALVAAAAPALAGFDLEHPPHVVRELIARLLAASSALLVAVGYAIVMCVGRRAGESAPVTGLRRLSAGAWLLSGLLGSYQLVFVNDNVDRGLQIVLAIGIYGGALAGVLVPLVGTLSRRSRRGGNDRGRPGGS